MTTALAPAPSRSLPALLRVDAALCAVLGAVLAVAPVADLLGPDVSSTVVRWLGVALLVHAAALALLARTRWARTAVLAAGVGNVAWEVGTFALVALGAFSVGGAVLAVAVGLVVGGLGLVQLRAVRG